MKRLLHIVGAGALVGACVGIATGLALSLPGGLDRAFDAEAALGVLVFALYFGTAYGVLVGIPLALLIGPTLLRRTPVRRANRGMLLGTGLGATAGVLVLTPITNGELAGPFGPYCIGTAVGILSASLRL